MSWGAGNPRTSTAQWQALRIQVLTRDSYRCACGNAANEVDHIVNWARGGTDDPSNLTAICRPCHARKTAQEGVDAKAQRRKGLKRAPKRHPGEA